MTTESGAEQPSDDEWAAELREKRAEKDEFFGEHPQSPIPPEDREEFDGLDYFEPDPEYQVTATVEVHDEPEPVEMDTTNGPPVRYLRVVTFAFDLDGESHEIHGYRRQTQQDRLTSSASQSSAERQEGDDSRTLFVPFRDKTTGQQTYDGGRYMELEPDRGLATDDEVAIDFNLAYTPFCAYSETFSCPLPPEENWLDAAIEAGERAP